MEITVSGTREWRLLGGVLRQCQLDVESTSGGLGNVGGVGTPNHQCSSRFMMRSSQCARAHQRPAQRLGVGVECAGVVGGPRRRRVASVWNRRAILRDVCWRMLGLIGNPTWQLVQSVGGRHCSWANEIRFVATVCQTWRCISTVCCPFGLFQCLTKDWNGALMKSDGTFKLTKTPKG